MSEWQPIETYDALEKKPKLAIFRFRPQKSNRHNGGFTLPETYEKTRYFGIRTATHWIEITEFKE